MIEFIVPIEPVPKGRPRFGNGHTFTPAKTRKFEADFSRFARKYRPMAPLDGPLQIALFFNLVPPKKCKRKHPFVRPDIDNLSKAVMDSLDGFWHDDAQIVCIYAMKAYAPIAGIRVAISQVFDA